MIDYKTNDYTLDNGFKIIHTPDTGRPIVALQAYVKCGSVWEKENEAGFSHFMEHLVFKSTKNYPANSIMDVASGLGASINAYTEYDSTCFYLTLPSESIEQGIELLAELIRHSNFSDKDFKPERQVVVEELKQYQNDPEENFVELIPAFYFKHNPYRNPIVGNLESLKNATPNDLRDFYKTRYTPDNCFLTVTGDYDLDNLKEIVEKNFTDWTADKSETVTITPEPFPEGFKYHYLPSKLRKDIIAIALPELSDLDPDAYSLNLTMKAFASGKNSNLYKRLYNQEQLVETVKLYSFSGKIDGVAAILIFPKNKKDIPKIFAIVLDELIKLKQKGLSEEAIRKHRIDLEHSYRYSFEFVESFSSILGSEELLGDYRHLYEYMQKVSEVTSLSVERVIQNIINLNYLQLIHTGKTPLDEEMLKSTFDEYKQIPTAKSALKDFEEITLSNGIQLQMKRVVGKPTVGFAASFNVSQLNEPSELTGINQFTAAMLQYGNNKRDYDSLLEYCVENGISISCDPLMDCTIVKSKCFSDRVSQSVELLADVIENPTFPLSHIKQYKQTCLSALDRMKDYPSSMAYHHFKHYFFSLESNLLSSMGEKKNLRAISRTQIIEWYSLYYAKAPLYISVVGDIDFEEVKALFLKHFKTKRNKRVPKSTIVAQTPVKSLKVIDTKQTQAVVSCGGKACTVNDRKHNTAFFVLSQIIGGDMNSRLFSELREEHGLAYSVGFDVFSYSDYGYFALNCITDRENDKFALKLIKQILKDIAENGVTIEELTVAKNYIKGQRLIGEESMMSQAKIHSYLKSLGYDYQYYLDRDKRLEDVTLDTIKEVAQKYFTDSNLFTLIYK